MKEKDMLRLGMKMNGFTLLNIVTLFSKTGERDGAVILGQRERDDEFVVALVDQYQVGLEGPAEHWGQGYYFQRGEGAPALEQATKLFVKLSELVKVAEPDPNQRPRTGCGCGFDIVYTDDGWQHDVAPSFWGEDHDPHPDADAEEAAKRWDAAHPARTRLDEAKSAVAVLIRQKYRKAEWYTVSTRDQGSGFVLKAIGFEDGTSVDHDDQGFNDVAARVDEALGSLSSGVFFEAENQNVFNVEIDTGLIAE